MTDLWQSLYDASLSQTLRNSTWGFPIIECIHIYSMVSLFALFAAFDLRLLGFAISGKARRRPLPELAKIVLHWIWIPILINLTTGLLMFAPNAISYAANSAFRMKILLVVIGLIYHLPLLFKASKWPDKWEAAGGLKLIGVLSLFIWFGIIVASRWIAYV